MQGSGTGEGWERLFWQLFERTTNPVTVLDEARCFVEINQPGLDLFGRRRAELIGSSIVDLVKPEERAASAAGWAELLRVGYNEGTRTFVRPDGSEIEFVFAARLAIVGERRLGIYVILPQGGSWILSAPTADSGTNLTPREREIVTLIAMGRGTTELAEELHISPDTVRTHVRNAMAKAGVHTRAELVAVVMCNEKMMDLPRLE
jgi:PAS domain S-box-containing protein